MKRTLAILLCVCLLLGGLPLVAFAHPGRTDSNGGHWNHSTGEYHIHGTPDNPGDSNPTGNTTNQHWEDPNEGNDLVLWIILVSFVVLLVYSLVQFFRKDKSRSTSKESKAAPLTDEKLTTPKKDDRLTSSTVSQNDAKAPHIPDAANTQVGK